MPSLGEAYIEVHADTGPFDRELAASIEKALIAAEATMRSRGRDAGNAFGEGVETAINDHVKRIGDNMSDGLVDAARNAGRRASAALNESITNVNVNLGVDVPVRLGDLEDDDLNDRRRRLTSWANAVASAMSGALSTTNAALSAFTGFFSRVSRMGTLFNPAVLVAAFGILSGAVFGLLNALTPLVALIAALPAFLGALGAVVLVVAAAFSGLGNSIGKIMGADTLDQALEVASRFEGGIGRFMEGIAFFSQVWRDIVTIVQDSFFEPFNDIITRVSKVFSSGKFLSNLRGLSTAMGEFAASLIGVFDSPAFKSFIDALLPSLTRMINLLKGPSASGLNGLFVLMEASLPFVERMAELFGRLLQDFEAWIDTASKSGSLDAFFKGAEETFILLGGIIKATWDLLASFIKTLQETGAGDNFLKTIIMVLEGLTRFFSSDLGQEAIVSMTEAAMGAIFVIGVLIITFTTFWAGLVKIFEFVEWLVGNIWNGISWVGRKIADFFIWLTSGVVKSKTDITNAWVAFTSTLATAWTKFSTGFTQKWTEVRTFLKNLPSTITNAVGSLSNVLYNAGSNVIKGLIQGLKDAVPGLQSTLGWIGNMIPNWKGPEEYDKKLLVNAGFQVMQGFRRGIAMGAADVFSDLRAITGMIGVNANANTFQFGPGAITQNFNGAQPSANAAQSLGSAVGAGIASAVNGQNMAASVRAI